MKKKFISILISNFNKEKYLYKCLMSCKDQKYNNFEIIIFDDNSTDKSMMIIKKFKNFKNLKIIQNKKRKKISGPLSQINSLKNAFNKSKGKIICLLDSDDYFEKDKISIVNKIFKNKETKFLLNYVTINNKNFKIKEKNHTFSIWPTIFPTSCISLDRKTFVNFLDYLYPNKFPLLEIDARLVIFAKHVLNNINYEKKKLTNYIVDPNGISSKSKKFSINWWLKRFQAFEYLKLLLYRKKIFFRPSIDYYITKVIYKIIKRFN